ncbi:MAG TPA: vitamin K epoxide reductase family protein [Candidatus Paceibacterota bacterium]|nr:vitamin K epoxide reductase family protein [Candidatus Paceibacterota bacterium]
MIHPMKFIEKLFTFEFFALLLSLAGLSICVYIRHKKGKKHPLVCPIGGNCNDVIYSSYSKTFGFSNEVGGIIYYGLSALTYFYLLLSIPIWPSALAILLFMSFGAFLFSIYLILVQAFFIKKWCVWCITSAIISTLLFFLAAFKYLV